MPWSAISNDCALFCFSYGMGFPKSSSSAHRTWISCNVSMLEILSEYISWTICLIRIYVLDYMSHQIICLCLCVFELLQMSSLPCPIHSADCRFAALVQYVVASHAFFTIYYCEVHLSLQAWRPVTMLHFVHILHNVC